MIGGQVLAVVGSIMSAVAPNVNTLVGGSVFIGLAASTQVLFPLLAQEIVPNKYRGYAQGTALLLVIPAIGFGPIIGRSMVASFGPSTGWRAVFWMNGAVALISLILFVFCCESCD
jgi:MFS family permease